jgi:hypothetical protein
LANALPAIKERNEEITSLRESLKLAVEALDNIGRGGAFEASSKHDAIVARQALAEITAKHGDL